MTSGTTPKERKKDLPQSAPPSVTNGVPRNRGGSKNITSTSVGGGGWGLLHGGFARKAVVSLEGSD